MKETETELNQLRRQLSAEKQAKWVFEIRLFFEKLLNYRHRQRQEKKTVDLQRMMDSTRLALTAENDQLKNQLSQLNKQVNVLKQQLKTEEKNHATVAVDNKNMQQQIKTLQKDQILLKEEISNVITKLNAAKTTSLRLNQELEEAEDKYELLVAEKEDLCYSIEGVLVSG